ncbi:hypothetical protein DRO58_05255 [Candidatus Bathyarchaeota archaeon]|nr:MAG: hypothetical protein DRO58_05255 [Candidatus Bathyarchaeota archaeon]
MAEERVEEKINWPLWILLAVIVNVLANLAQGVLGVQGQFFGCIYSMGIVSIPFTLPTLALMLPMLAFPLRFLKGRLSTTSLAALYILGLVSSMSIGNFNDAYYSWPVGSSSRVWRAIPEVRDAMSKLWWVPPESALLPTWTTGGPVDWGAWLPAMLYVFLFHFIILIMTSAQMVILRRRWIEIEKVPYPFAIAIWESVRNIHGFEEVKHRKRQFLIGVAIGLFLYLAILLRFLFPWFPDLIGYYTAQASAIGCVDGLNSPVSSTIGASLVAFMRWNIQPINYAIAYLMPLDILFTTWLLWLIFMIMAQIAHVMGYYTGFETVSGADRVLLGPYTISPNWGPPIYWSWMCVTGGMVAFIVMMLWHARDYLREVFGAIFGTSAKARAIEAREPISYRMAFIQLLIGCVLLIAFFASLQIDFVLGSILFIFGGFIYPLAEAYARGLTGAAYAQERSKWPSWPVHLIYSRHPGTYTPGWCNALIMMHRGINTASGGFNTWSVVTMHSFRVADLSGIHPKTIYQMVFVFFVIAYAITLPFRVWWPHLLGARFPNCLSGWECAMMGEGAYNYVPPAEELVGPIIAGFIITVLLSSLRARFTWWPLHPMGFLISGAAREVWTGAWTNFLVAWVLKWVTLRVGGSRAYEEYGVPVAAGVLTGFVMVAILGSILGLIRWFIPF